MILEFLLLCNFGQNCMTLYGIILHCIFPGVDSIM